MNRKERRAAEHAACKAERKAGFQNLNPTAVATAPTPIIEVTTIAPPPAPDPELVATPTKSEPSVAQLTANRQNAKLSTGAKTEAGKAKCSHNAVKTALTGQTILLPTDDVAAYEDLGRIFISTYKPIGTQEELLVQSLIEAQWRLIRIPTLVAGILAIGRRELADSVPAHLLEAEVYLKYERNLKNLDLQENRIRRNREKDLKDLTQLQAARFEREAILRKLQQAKEKQQASQPGSVPQPAPAPEIGFVFSPADLPLAKAA